MLDWWRIHRSVFQAIKGAREGGALLAQQQIQCSDSFAEAGDALVKCWKINAHPQMLFRVIPWSQTDVQSAT